ncbi:hypothetical protein [Microbacterium sp. NPDC058345]|uniref:hypothetical protein n=1 Tax=Microbacterium sp. NPDC058345 TaxID=3346455 RepID=UPI003661D02D
MTEGAGDGRQRVVRVPGSRRAKLTPAPGTDTEPESADARRPAPEKQQGPNDDRMLRDVPPHY